MTRYLGIDLETYSSTDLRQCGVYRYAEATDFEILLAGYAWDEEPVQLIDVYHEGLPQWFKDALFDPAIVKRAYNSQFEVTCLNRALRKPLDVGQWRCVQALGLVMGLPGHLGEVAEVMRLDVQKDSRGSSLIRKLCVPCKPTKSNGGRTRNLPDHCPEDWETFKSYCKMDVEVERAIWKKLLKWAPQELAL